MLTEFAPDIWLAWSLHMEARCQMGLGRGLLRG